jgi:hypothetical protein
MGTQTLTEPVQSGLQITHWNLASRLGFRFAFVYFGLFCLGTQVLTNLFSSGQGIDLPDLSTLWPLRQIVLWTAAHVFHRQASLSLGGNSGSGDDLFGWVLHFCLLIIAVLATGVWSLVDKKRENYVTLHEWFRLFLRLSLAGQMLNYGLAKAVPIQMPFPALIRLVEPFGNFSPMGVLWSSIGASPAYEIFAGFAEVLGGVLLVFPRTATLGALICLADMIQVFMLNMTYDVPVKLFSFHLLLASLFLLVPDLPGLISIFFLNRGAEPSIQGRLFRTRGANWTALAAQILFGAWLLGMNVYGARARWYTYGGGRVNSSLYGIWEVSQMSIDEQVRPALLTDNGRWRRVIFDTPTRVAFQRMDESFVRYGASINQNKIALTKDGDTTWKAEFAVTRPVQDQLVLDGDMDRHKIHMQLQLTDRHSFLLVNRGFHWIQESSFNR